MRANNGDPDLQSTVQLRHSPRCRCQMSYRRKQARVDWYVYFRRVVDPGEPKSPGRRKCRPAASGQRDARACAGDGAGVRANGWFEQVFEYKVAIERANKRTSSVNGYVLTGCSPRVSRWLPTADVMAEIPALKSGCGCGSLAGVPSAPASVGPDAQSSLQGAMNRFRSLALRSRSTAYQQRR